MKAEDIVIHGGASTVVLGVYFIYWPAALIVAGSYIFFVACLHAVMEGVREERKKKEKDK